MMFRKDILHCEPVHWLAAILIIALAAYWTPPLLANGGDNCSDAPLITHVPFVDSTGNTTNANSDYGHCGIQGSRDVIYTLRLPCDYTITASLCGSTLSAYVDVRTGGNCPGDSIIVCDAFACGNQRGQVTFTARGNRDYYVLVYGRCSALQCYFGSYQLSITGTPLPPANDTCPGTQISSLPFSDEGCTNTATNNYYNCVTWNSPEVVYTLNIPSCQTVHVSTCGSNFNTALSVFTGGDQCPGLYLVRCNEDDYCGGVFTQQSNLSFVAAANTNYYIQVAGSGTARGHYVLNVTGTPFTATNDVCPGTTIVTGLPYFDVGNTGCVAHNYDVACSPTSSPDVVYAYTSDYCDVLVATLCGSAYDAMIDVRAGGDCPGEVSVQCNNDYPCTNTVIGGPSQVTFDAYQGVTYYFVVTGFQGAAGPFNFGLYHLGVITPAPDVCPGATINSLPFTDVASTSCMNHDYPNFMGNLSPDAVYTYTSTTCQNVSVSLCGSSYDTGLSVYRNGSCPGAALVVGNDDTHCEVALSAQSAVSFQASPGTQYWILVHGYLSQSGPYAINVTGQPCDSLAQVDSLVIINIGPDIYLNWKSQGPAYQYNIYRSPTLAQLMDPENRIAVVTDYHYYFDVGILSTPNPQYFYAVTVASLPTLIGQDNGASRAGSANKATLAPKSRAAWAADRLAPHEPSAGVKASHAESWPQK